MADILTSEMGIYRPDGGLGRYNNGTCELHVGLNQPASILVAS